MIHTVTRIISGAQTGADRGGLEAAWDLKLATGGYAPLGWRSEDGEIPEPYRCGMIQSSSSHYPIRTELNIQHSDGTLILSLGPLNRDSGSILTAKIARRLNKPVVLLIIETEWHSTMRVQRARSWLRDNHVCTLNVAGPRESREPGIQAAVRACLVQILGENQS